MRTVQLVIPMAGLGTRFQQAGYPLPKPLLPVGDMAMFELVIANLMDPSISTVTLIAQREWNLAERVESVSRELQTTVNLIEIDYLTDGPASTVELAAPWLDPSRPVVTANSDQYVDADLTAFYRAVQDPSLAGVILAMGDSSPKWSYVRTDSQSFALEIKEKEVISPLATVGIYGWRSAAEMLDTFAEMRMRDDRVRGELYVGPAYNYVIRRGERVLVEDLGPVSTVMHGLGVPEDYEAFLQRMPSLLRISAVNPRNGREG